jgi:drug/metabolite transporter (DMT)-like permease
MTWLSLGIVIFSAFTHASWNYISKKTDGGIPFTILISAVATVIYAPLTLFVLINNPITIGWFEIFLLSVSTLFQFLYFNLLTQAYRVGDMSVVYPIARGAGPMFSLVMAIIVLGERPSLIAIGGALCIGVGVVVLSRAAMARVGALAHGRSNQRKAIVFALMVGVSVMSYTIWDKVQVSRYAIPPNLVNWATQFGLTLLFLPYTLRNKTAVWQTWQKHKRAALIVGTLYPLAYLLVLIAMTFTPVSYIAPAREISVLIGSFMGMHLLGEGASSLRILGALIMTFGVIALALG